MTTWAHNTAHYCGIWSGDPVWLRLRLRFSSFCSEQALLSIIFFFPAPITVPARAGHFADSFRSLWKDYCRAERTKCFVRKDGFYFKVFPLIVHLCGELLLFEAKVSRKGWSECVCVRACVCTRSQAASPFVSICCGKYSTLPSQRAEQGEFASLFIFLHRDPTRLLMASCLRSSPSIAMLSLFMIG